ncbi:MAG: trigger factor [Solirubrobacteraceae bacterium]
MSAVTTTVTELPESRVKIAVEVAPKTVEQAMLDTARVLGRDLRVPGFRKGKVPPPVVIRRYGRETVLDETLRRSLGEWLVAAVDDAGVSTVGEPSVDIGKTPEPGGPVLFELEVGVRPVATLGDLATLEVGRREATPDPERIDKELEQLRERHGKLEKVDRAAAEGDSVLVSFVGRIDGEEFEGGAGRDQLIELGSGRLVPGFEDQLQGAEGGQEREVRVTFPDDYGAEQLRGVEAVFTVEVHEVQERTLPELDDTFAEEAAGADSLAELRDEIGQKLSEQDDVTIEREYRDAVLDTVALRAEVEIPESLATARAAELLDQTLHQLSHQGISRELYFQMTGRSEEDVVAEAVPEAERNLRREAALHAFVAAEEIEPAEGDLLSALQQPAMQQGTTPEKLLKRLTKQGHLDELRDDVAQQQAIERLLERATAVSVEDARAKGLLWTPVPGEPAPAGGRPWATEDESAADDAAPDGDASADES